MALFKSIAIDPHRGQADAEDIVKIDGGLVDESEVGPAEAERGHDESDDRLRADQCVK